MITAISILLLCTPIDEIVKNYYGEESFSIASVESVCEDGFNRQLGYNRIARANYKHANYSRALRFAHKVRTTHKKLSYDTRSLRALLYINTGQLGRADSLYRVLLAEDIPYKRIRYEVHINYAELLRLNMNYKGREQHLLQALSLAGGRERNKTIRVLARHYFGVLNDFDSANKMITAHGDPRTKEGEAGFLLLLAQYHEAKHAYEKAMKYYIEANRIARGAGFVGFSYQAVDGAMRSEVLLSSQTQRNMFSLVMAVLVASFLLGFFLYNTKGFKVD